MVGLSFLAGLAVFFGMLNLPTDKQSLDWQLWTWIPGNGLNVQMALRVDPLRSRDRCQRVGERSTPGSRPDDDDIRVRAHGRFPSCPGVASGGFELRFRTTSAAKAQCRS